jgi:GNAT superfamily N-acetyltransferase
MASGTETIAYSLRAATAADAAFIYALRVAGLKEYVGQTWGWDETVEAARFQKRFDPADYQLVEVGGRDVGAVAVEWRDMEVFLADIEIVPEWQRCGLGTAIITTILAEARQRKLPASLQVLKVNPARRLYERLGFRVVEETQTHVLMRTPMGAKRRGR